MTTMGQNFWPLVKLGQIVDRVENLNPIVSLRESFHYIDISSVDNITKSLRSPSLISPNEAPSRARQVVQPGDVLISTVRPGLNAVAKVPDTLTSPIASTGFCVLRAVDALLDANFLFHFVTTDFFISRLVSCQKGGSYPAVTDSDVLTQLIPLPPLSEQQRIVEVLRESEEIRRLRAQAEAKTAELISAIFHDRFVRDQAHQYEPLHKLAEVVSGVAIGRKSRGMAIEVPYIRVANVQAGYMDLTEVKTTTATENEIEQYALQNGDVLLTEGGDFDKLGRGALWEGQVTPCIHQNHVFRVRPDREKLLPRFFAHYLQSARAKGYFLRCAKKTTNLASINLTQLMALPVPKISLDDQLTFETEVELASRLLQKEPDKTFVALTASLSAHAFSGQLTVDWRETHKDKLAIEVRERDEALHSTRKQIFSFAATPPPRGFVEVIFKDRTDGVYSDLNREQRFLLREIKRMFAGVDYGRYFTAEKIADEIPGPLHRNPQGVLAHLQVFATRGLLIPVSRRRKDSAGSPFAGCYRLPLKASEKRKFSGVEDFELPEQAGDDVREELMKIQRRLATGSI
jgi:type I restriction enzyme S subunit